MDTKEYQKQYRINNWERIREIEKKSKAKRLSKDVEYNKKRRHANVEKHRAYYRAYNAKNREKLKAYFRKLYPKRKAKLQALRARPVSRIAASCRERVRHCLRREGVEKNQSTFDLIGCSPAFFKTHIESQFTNGMSWDNYGREWEIDHKIPICKFDLLNEVERFQAFHYSNCQPLTKYDNRTKSKRTFEIQKGNPELAQVAQIVN